MPEAPTWERGLTSLLGDRVRVSEEPIEGDLAALGYITRLVDDEGQMRGAFLVDATAVIELGGRLLMLPDGAREDMRKTEPSEDVLEGMSEVLNVMSRYVNELDGADHIRATPLVPIALGIDDWLDRPRTRRDLRDEYGGRMALLSM